MPLKKENQGPNVVVVKKLQNFRKLRLTKRFKGGCWVGECGGVGIGEFKI